MNRSITNCYDNIQKKHSFPCAEDKIMLFEHNVNSKLQLLVLQHCPKPFRLKCSLTRTFAIKTTTTLLIVLPLYLASMLIERA
jgi:hypothetical protein